MMTCQTQSTPKTVEKSSQSNLMPGRLFHLKFILFKTMPTPMCKPYSSIERAQLLLNLKTYVY